MKDQIDILSAKSYLIVERPYNKKAEPIKRKINTFRTGDKFNDWIP